MALDNRKKMILLGAGAIAGLAMVAAGLLSAARPAGQAVNMGSIEPAAHESPVAGADIGGDYTLIDHHGKRVTNKDFSGHYTLIFFGFTYCPDICPAELKKISMVMEQLEGTAVQIKPLFVSIDPERDTPDVLKDYLRHFDSRITGLTGSIEEIEHMEKIFRVYAAKIDDPRYTDYLVNHSSMIYFMSPSGSLLRLFQSEDTPAKIAKHIRQVIDNG